MILLIDGRSGSGKTTLARRFGRVGGWPIVHLEDVYPGWGGLAGSLGDTGTADSQPVARTLATGLLPLGLAR